MSRLLLNIETILGDPHRPEVSAVWSYRRSRFWTNQYGPTYSVPNRKLLLLYAPNQLAAVNKFTKTGWHAKTT